MTVPMVITMAQRSTENSVPHLLSSLNVSFDLDKDILGIEYINGYIAGVNDISEESLLSLVASCVLKIDSDTIESNNAHFPIQYYEDIDAMTSYRDLIDESNAEEQYTVVSVSAGTLVHYGCERKSVSLNRTWDLYHVDSGQRVVWSSFNGQSSSITDNAVDNRFALAFPLKCFLCYLKLIGYLDVSSQGYYLIGGKADNDLFVRIYLDDHVENWAMQDFWLRPNGENEYYCQESSFVSRGESASDALSGDTD